MVAAHNKHKDIALIKPLTSLRFFAAAMIVVGHSHHLLGSLGIALTFQLSQGVAFFFVLSGFILSYNYQSLPNKQSAARFMVARFARIWPLHIATLLIWLAVITPNITHEFSNPTDGAIKLALNFTLLQSWAFLAPYILSFNGVAWSISTEAFFYVVFAIIVLSPARRLPIALALASFCVVAFLASASVFNLSPDDSAPGLTMFGTVYTNPLVRVFEFLFGVVLAQAYRKHGYRAANISYTAWAIIEIAAVGLIVLALRLVAATSAINNFAGAGVGYYVYKEGLWLLWGLLILVFALSRGPLAKLLSIRPMVFLGEISFALYLVHVIILNLADRQAETVQSMGALGAVLFWLVCLSSSAALHISVENPFRKIIINLWDKKSKSRKTNYFQAPQWLGLGILFCGSVFAATYQPSTVKEISRSAISAPPVAENQYSNGISLISAEIVNGSSGNAEIKLYFTLTKSSSLDKYIAVHLNDEKGNILKVVGNINIDASSTEHPKGFTWINTVSVSSQDIDQAKSIGIATFKDIKVLDDVTQGPSDWGGKRLIIKLPLK